MIRRLLSLFICTGILCAGLAAGCSATNSAGMDPAVTTAIQTTAADEATDAEATTSGTTAADAAGTTAADASGTTAAEPDRFLTVELVSDSIGDNNLLGDPGKEKIFVYLPPSYFDSAADYPVVYYFHGFGETPGTFLSTARRQLDKFFEDGGDEFIMVEVAGGGYSGGSFYANSTVTGNWDDYVIKEVIPLVDLSYRTLAGAASRGICGFSMGGFGAMNLALLHPDVFAAVYAMSPGIMKDDALTEAMDTWTGDTAFLKAYSQAFAPDVSEGNTSLGLIPALDGSPEDNKIAALWYGGFGNWGLKIDAYLALNTPLAAIGISYGDSDGYTWIPTGSAYFSGLLREKGIEPTEFAFEGGHQIPSRAISDHLGPFFRDNLSWES